MSRNPPVPHPTLSLNLRARDCADELLAVAERRAIRAADAVPPRCFPILTLLQEARYIVRIGRSGRYVGELLNPTYYALEGWIQLLLNWREEGSHYHKRVIRFYEDWVTEHHPDLYPPFYDPRWDDEKFLSQAEALACAGQIDWIRWMREEIAKGGE